MGEEFEVEEEVTFSKLLLALCSGIFGPFCLLCQGQPCLPLLTHTNQIMELQGTDQYLNHKTVMHNF